jgi:hypothetical protein
VNFIPSPATIAGSLVAGSVDVSPRVIYVVVSVISAFTKESVLTILSKTSSA